MAISLTSSGIVFTGTQSPAQSSGSGAAYTLDDYEEGTWTPVISPDMSNANYDPDYVKIDVDGIESLIIKESDALLSNENLYDVSIEIDENNKSSYNTITNKMKKFGFSLKQKKHAAIFDQPALASHSSVYNFIFSRQEAQFSLD